jgi:MFS family permease
MTVPRGLRALGHAQFRLFFAAQLVSLIGSWMQTVAQSWLVLQLADSAFKLGLIGTLQMAPVLLFSLVSGVVADRLPKRRLIVATQALTLGLLVASGHVHYWHVAVLAVLSGFASVLDMPARQSYVLDLVGKDDLVNAIALNSAAFNAARIVGPAAAGLLIARFGVVPAFLINSAGFVVVIVALLRLDAEGKPAPRSGNSLLVDIGAGITYALDTVRVRLLLGLLLAVSLCVFNFTVYVPLLARNVLGLGAEGFGFLMAALGVGAVAGALTVGTLRNPPLLAMFIAAFVACGCLTAMAAVRHAPAAVGLLFVIGFSGIVLVASCNTALQLIAPDELRGRVMSLYTLIWGGAFPIGAFMVGSISELWGVSTAFFVMGSIALVALLALSTWWRLRAERASRISSPVQRLRR